MRRLLLFLFAGIAAANLQAQSDSAALRLKEIEIVARKTAQKGFATFTTDSLFALSPGSLSGLPVGESGFLLRTQAPGVLATLSARGAGASRTPVFWEGINLQSPMNGTVDASLLPIWPEDKITFQYGGQSAFHGSGAMGGSVEVRPGPVHHESSGVQGGISAGSFGRLEGHAGIRLHRGRWNMTSRGRWEKAENNFPYFNEYLIGKPLERRTGNYSYKSDLQQYIQFYFNQKNRLRAAWWRQKADRQIPQPVTAISQNARQFDRSDRLSIAWFCEPDKKTSLQVRSALAFEKIGFKLHDNVDTSISNTLSVDASLHRFAFNRFRWKTGVNLLSQTARSDGYVDTLHSFRRRRAAAYGLLNYALRHWNLSFLVRHEKTDGVAAVTTWSAGWRYENAQKRGFEGHFSRNFNLPTLNDLFWAAWGDPTLRPEKGYSADAAWFAGGKKGEASTRIYHLWVDDWIQWAPDPTGVFRPYNLQKVWSRGVELSFSRSGALKSVEWNQRFRLDLNDAIVRRARAGAEDRVGKQLVYTPRITASWVCNLEYKRLTTSYLHYFCGYRFVTTDNSATVPSFSTGRFSGKYSFSPVLGIKAVLHIAVDNIWNVDYEIFKYYPMPGRNFSIGAIFSY